MQATEGVAYSLICGDALAELRRLPDESVQCCVTSPPYWGLRDYGMPKQIGLEKTPKEYVARLAEVFREVRRVLKNDGTCWINLGDSFGTGKQLQMIPARVALILQRRRWIVRMDIVWHKSNPMPESVTDRPTKAHEYLFMLAKSERYFYNASAIREPAMEPSRVRGDRIGHTQRTLAARPIDRTARRVELRNKHSVWTMATEPFPDAHFAVMPEALVEPCILAGSQEGDAILDPFCGSGTVGAVALLHNRMFIGIDLNPDYLKMAHGRLWRASSPLFSAPTVVTNEPKNQELWARS